MKKILILICFLAFCILGDKYIRSGQRKTINELRAAVEFYKRNVIYQDFKTVDKIHSFQLSAINGEDRILLYYITFPYPIIVKDGYELCTDVNRIGTY